VDVRRPVALLLWAVACLATSCGGGGGRSSAGPAPEPPPPTQAELDWADEILDLVNQVRQDAGVGLLAPDAAAADAAYGHAYDMEVREFFDHVNPTGEWPADRLRRAGATFQGSGENIAQGYDTPQDVMDAWMASPGHRENILRPQFGRLGVGVRLSPGGPWWVQNFLAP
jgi:uncharacterized protein YkwD